MPKLLDVLEQSQKNHKTVGHFNIADLVLLKAVFSAARELKVPVSVANISRKSVSDNPEHAGSQITSSCI